jgi:hypothetical protein
VNRQKALTFYLVFFEGEEICHYDHGWFFYSGGMNGVLTEKGPGHWVTPVENQIQVYETFKS